MKLVRTLVWGCSLWCAVALAAEAACTGSGPFLSTADPAGGDASRSFVWSGANFDPFYFETYDPLDYRTPFVAPSGSFWVLGQGDPAVGIGSDNGSFDLVAGLSGGGIPTYGLFYAAELDTCWGESGIDGAAAPDACTCLLISDTDADGRVGTFAAVASRSDLSGNTVFRLAGEDPLGNAAPIVLRPIAAPGVVSVDRQGGTVEMTVRVGGRSGGVYASADGAGCDCGPTHYLVYGRVVTKSDDWLPPADRDPAAWTLLATAGGGGQGITPVDTEVTVQAVCSDPAMQRIYLATQLVFDGGFSTAYVSTNSLPVECDAAAPTTDPLAGRGTVPSVTARGRKDR